MKDEEQRSSGYRLWAIGYWEYNLANLCNLWRKIRGICGEKKASRSSWFPSFVDQGFNAEEVWLLAIG